MKIARYEKRMFGWVIDEIMALGPAIAFFFFIRTLGGAFSSVYLALVLSFLVQYVAYFILVPIFMGMSGGSTLGMLIFGIRCYTPEGGHISGGQCFLRSLLTGIWAMDLLNAVYMLLVHTERSVFDRLTDSLVIDFRHPDL